MKRNDAALNGVERGRLYAGLAGLIVAIGYGQQTLTTLDMGKADEPGAAVFPLAVSLVLAASSAAVILEQYRSNQPSTGESPVLPQGKDLHRLLGTGLAVLCYVALAPFVGHLVASFPTCLIIVHILGEEGWRNSIVRALVISVAIYVLFEWVLGVVLPRGIFG